MGHGAQARSNAALVLLALTASAATTAHAQTTPPMNGVWRAGATAINVAVESWGKDCGPEPRSSQSKGGGIVRIDQQGERLSLIGSGRTVHSDQCFGQNPGLSRKSKSFKDNTWTTHCETSQTDPRAEAGTYTLKLLNPDRLLYQDVSRFRWELKTSLCVATITTVQTLTRESGAPPAPVLPDLPTNLATDTKATKAQTKAAQTQAQTNAAKAQTQTQATTAKVEPPPCVPGEAKRLLIGPRDPRIELGGRVCFRSRLLDAAGCALPAPTPTWTLDHGPALRARLDARGCFEASSQAAEGEGKFSVSASVGALRAETSIEVVAADLSALVAKRLFDADAGVTDDGEVAAAPTAAAPSAPELATPAASSRTATRAVTAAPTEAGTPMWLWAVALGVVGVLGIAIVLALRRRGEEDEPPAGPAAVAPAAPIAPPAAAAPITAAKKAVDLGKTAVFELRCPKCGATYPPGSSFCGTDGSPLS